MVLTRCCSGAECYHFCRRSALQQNAASKHSLGRLSIPSSRINVFHEPSRGVWFHWCQRAAMRKAPFLVFLDPRAIYPVASVYSVCSVLKRIWFRWCQRASMCRSTSIWTHKQLLQAHTRLQAHSVCSVLNVSDFNVARIRYVNVTSSFSEVARAKPRQTNSSL